MQYNEALKRFRKGRNLNQQKICDILKIPQPQYSRYERGERKLKADQIIAICKEFDVSADYLLGLSDIDKKYSNNEQGNSSDI